MEPAPPSPQAEQIERFAVNVFSELTEGVIVRRPRAVAVLLRMAMLAALEMELPSTLNLLCDLASEIVPHHCSAAYFWDDDSELMQLRAARNMPEGCHEEAARASVLNYWAAKVARPLLLSRQAGRAAELLLRSAQADTLLVVPLFVRNRVLGTLHLFGEGPGSFADEDVQLMWVLALVAESILARDYSHETLLRFAYTDYLTGLKSRGFLEQQLELEMARAERRSTPLALLMVDIDHFKLLNDNFGHHSGDVVLRDLATMLTRGLREVDTAARYGGEEFLLLLPDTDLQGAQVVAQRLRAAVEGTSFYAPQTGGLLREIGNVTVSIGVATYPAQARSKRALVEASDAAMYEAKARGRNRVVLYGDLSAGHEQAG